MRGSVRRDTVLDGRSFVFIALFAVLMTGCSSLPGLRVLTGQEDEQTVADRTVQIVELVMADKTGSTDPSIIAAADRIEQAATTIDIVEIRQNQDTGIFEIKMLFRPPQTENTLQGQIQQLEALRRAFELSWQGTLRESVGSEVIRVTILQPAPIDTLNAGVAYAGIVVAEGDIERAAAISYLSGERSLIAFNDLIVDGTLAYYSPEQLTFYEGSPNHPMFMLPAGQ